MLVWLQFQFQTGSIKRREWDDLNEEEFECFNSKLVRLKVLVMTIHLILLVSFNSKLVRLKEAEMDAWADEMEKVSIPNWFD